MDRLQESYRRLHDPLWRYLLVECGDVSVAEDVEIEVFVRVGAETDHGEADHGGEEFDRRAWNLAVDSIASAGTKRWETLEAAAASKLPVTLIDPDTPDVAGILQPLDGLPERQRRIVALRYAADLNAGRIADLLSTSEDAIEVELQRALPPPVRLGLGLVGEIRPPDLWPRISAGLAPATPTPRFRHRRLAAAAAAALLVTVGFGLRWLADPTTGSAAPPVPTTTSAPSGSSTVWQPERSTAPRQPDARRRSVNDVATDAAGVWVAEPGRGIANLDPATGDVRWRLALDGTVDGVQGVPGVGWFVWSSFTGEGDHRPPVVLRVDPVSGEVLWRTEGRSGFDWRGGPLAVSDDQIFVADVADTSEDAVWVAEPSRPAPGGRSSIRVYDVERGALDFAVAVDGWVGVATGAPLVHVLPNEDEPIVLATVLPGLLSRIDPSDGMIRWSQPLDPAVTYRSAGTEDGTRVVRVSASPAGSYYLDAETGRRLADASLPSPPPGCRTYHGEATEIALHRSELSDQAAPTGATAAPPDCVVVAESQDLRLRNDGSGPMTLSWLGRRLSVGPDDVVEWPGSGPASPLGPTVVDVEPHPDLTVWVMASESSPTAGVPRTAGSYGPVEVGMYVVDASARLGRDLELLVHDTAGACVVIAGDPYSPFFRAVAGVGGLIITGIDAECSLEPNGSRR
ncbi:MAG: PQQ-binding-like beta-propeller repeat protein [Acidimicrobiia bacterium]|nr:PQQ-binding-like beta-propeller repeat protein [Acidimicrobiia bacterium]